MGGAEGADEGAAVAAASALHVARFLQRVQGFAQGDAAHAEAGGEVAFGGEAFAGRGKAQADRLQEAGQGFLERVARADRAEQRVGQGVRGE
ncbi:hypothetical protein GCM10023148_29070 [Actinokineospora soli]